MAQEKENKEQLRAQAALLLSQAKSQAADIQRMLAALPSDSPLRARLADAAAQISSAISSLSNALGSSVFPLHAADLVTLNSAVDSGGAVVTEAAQAAATATVSQAVITASAATRHEVQSLEHDIYDRHIFDRYLHFSSREDEEEFRKREAATHQYVDQQLAEGTPEGDLKAALAMQDQMRDLKAHGAGKSPDFATRSNALNERIQSQRSAMQTDGRTTKDRGEPSAASNHSLPSVGAPQGASTEGAQLGTDFDSVAAKLRAAVVQSSDSTDSGHGLAVQKPGGKTTTVLGG